MTGFIKSSNCNDAISDKISKMKHFEPPTECVNREVTKIGVKPDRLHKVE